MKALFLVYDKDYTFFPYIKDDTVVVESLWKKRSHQFCFWAKVFRKLHVPLEIWGRVFFSHWMKSVDEYSKILVFDAVYEPLIGEWMKRKKLNASVYMWDGKNRQRLSGKQALEVLSFNPSDAEKGMKFQKSFYCEDALKGLDVENQYDVFYCGRIKRRKKSIDKYCGLLKKAGLKTCFHIVSGEIEQNDVYTTFLEELDYAACLQYSAKSRAILNIVDEEEYGAITLRCLEAMYLGKKLITNDTEIRYVDFYNENNILVLTDDMSEEEQIEAIKEFMKKENEPVPMEIQQSYSIHSFVSQYCNEI